MINSVSPKFASTNDVQTQFNSKNNKQSNVSFGMKLILPDAVKLQLKKDIEYMKPSDKLYTLKMILERIEYANKRIDATFQEVMVRLGTFFDGKKPQDVIERYADKKIDITGITDASKKGNLENDIKVELSCGQFQASEKGLLVRGATSHNFEGGLDKALRELAGRMLKGSEAYKLDKVETEAVNARKVAQAQAEFDRL